MKANWSCTACGMYSGRRYCVQRHIDNIHKGNANAIPFIEYLVGRREGLYPPKGRPSFGSKKRTIVEKTQDEVENMYVRRAAETFLPPVGDDAYRSLIKGVLDDKVRQYWEEIHESLKFFQNNSKPNVPAVHGTTSKGATQYDLHNDDLVHNDVDLTNYKKMLEDFIKQTKVKLS
jgi:hypothetical protein